MQRTIVDKLPNCKKRYSKSKDIIVCENGEVYVPWKEKYHKLTPFNTGGHKNMVYVYHKGASYNVAKEVWLAFTGEKAALKDYIVPKDGNMFNNNISNLEKKTRSEIMIKNNSFPRSVKIRNKITGEIYPTAKTVSQMEKVSQKALFDTLNGKWKNCAYPHLKEKYEIIEK